MDDGDGEKVEEVVSLAVLQDAKVVAGEVGEEAGDGEAHQQRPEKLQKVGKHYDRGNLWHRPDGLARHIEAGC